MVLLLNVLPYLIVLSAIGLWFVFKTRKAAYWAIGVIIATALIYPKVQPSYLPKYDIKRTSVPELGVSSAEMQDRNRKPVPSEVRQERMEEEYRQGAVK